MGKVLATVGVIVTATALIATGVGAAAGAGLLGAEAAAVAGSAGALTIAGVSLTELAVVGAGLSFVGGLLEGTPKVGQTAAGTQVDFQALSTAGVPVAFGRTGTAGNIIRQAVNGTHDKYIHYLTCLSGAGPVKSISAFTANGAAVDFSADGGEGATGFYANRMWWKTRVGNPDGSGMAWSAQGGKDVPATHGGTPLPIAQGGLSGLACTLWALEYDPAIYPGGTPKPLAVIEGIRVYDPRLDDTYPGGAGPQRAADQNSWGWSGFENPYLQALAWVIGRYENGRPTVGVHAPLNAIDIAAFVNGANVADANGWKAGGVIYSTDDKFAVLTTILQAGAGRPLKLGAKISCFVNAPRVSLDTLTGADVVGDASIAAIQPVRSRLDTIFPRYREETAGWQIVPTAHEVAVAAYVPADNGPRSKEVEYTFVQSADQAATMARYDIEDGREFGPIVLPCKPRWMGYRPGDCITVDEPEYGLNAQPCLIMDREVDPATMVCTLTLRSETPGKHAFALGQTADPPADAGLTGVDILSIPAPDPAAWSIVDTSFTGVDGAVVPAIVVAGASDNAYVAAIVLEHRTAAAGASGAGEWTPFSAPATAVRIVDTNVAGGVVYDVRIRYRTIRGVDSAPLSLGQVNTPSLTASDTANVAMRPSTVVLSELDAATAAIQAIIAEGGQDTAQLQAAVADALAKFGSSGDDLNAQAIARLTQSLFDVRQALAKLAPGGLPVGPYFQEIHDTGAASAQTLGILAYSVNPTTNSIVLNDSNVSYADGTSLANYRTVVATMLGATNATVATNYSASSSALASQASLITGLQSNYGSLSSTVVSNYTTLSNADYTEAQARLSLASTVGSLSSTVNSNYIALTSADSTEATARLALASNYNAFQSSASSQLVTLANGQSSLAAQYTTLSASYGSLMSTVSTQASTLANLNGQLVGSYQVAVTTDNAGRKLVTGLSLVGSSGPAGNVSLFQVLADHAAFVGSDGSIISFNLVGGGQLQVQNLLVGNLTVGTSQLAYGSGLQTAYAANRNGFSSDTSNLVSVGITALGGAVSITGTLSGYYVNATGQDITFNISISRDGGSPATFPITVPAAQAYTIQSGGTAQPENPSTLTVNGYAQGPWTFTFQDTPPAGGHTYYLGVSGSRPAGAAGTLDGNFASLTVGAAR